MEIRISTAQILTVLLVISWIIFIGLSIDAGAFIVNAVFAVARPELIERLWQKADLTDLYRYDRGHFVAMGIIMSIVAVAKALLFYQIIKLLHHRKLDLTHPFNKHMRYFIFRAAWLSLLIGVFSRYGVGYASWMTQQGVKMPDTENMRLGGGDVWIFMAVILFVIAQIFKRGEEIQTENELTV